MSLVSMLSTHVAPCLPHHLAPHLAAVGCRLPQWGLSKASRSYATKSFRRQGGRSHHWPTEQALELAKLWMEHRKQDTCARRAATKGWLFEAAKKCAEFAMIEADKKVSPRRNLAEKLPKEKCTRSHVWTDHRNTWMQSAEEARLFSIYATQMQHHVRDSPAPEGGGRACQKHPSAPPNLKISLFRRDKAESTSTIPGSLFGLVGKLMPPEVDGVDIEAITQLLSDPCAAGTVLEFEDFEKEMKTVISLECDVNLGKNAACENATLAADLKITVHKNCGAEPAYTTKMSGHVIALSWKLLPEKARSALEAKGVCLEEIAKFATSPHAKGATILIHDDLKHDHRVVISLE